MCATMSRNRYKPERRTVVRYSLLLIGKPSYYVRTGAREGVSVPGMVRATRAAAMLLAALIVSLVSAGAREAQQAGSTDERAKNVIIFIGDGMGSSHRDLVRYATVGTAGQQLAMDSMPYAGRSETSPLDPEAFVTDSAAGGTAIATGVKTFNGAVGIDAAENPVPTVLERAREAGKATGLVSNSQITDATPASFAAHVADRDEQSEIARQYIQESKPDVILGGGEDYWYPEGEAGAHPDEPKEDPQEKSAGTEGDLVRRAQDLGYEYVTDAAELRMASGPQLLGLFANEEMFQQAPEGEGAVYEPPVSLSEMTQKAIETLSLDPDGFFLMVEEEGIDEMAHQSNAELVIEAGQHLDEAVKVGKSFAERDRDTLVIVAADHETGSLAIEDTNEIQSDPDYPNESGEGRTAEDGPFRVVNSDKRFLVDWTTTNHTAEDVPVTAMGPGGQNLVGVYENTHIHDAMLSAFFASSSAPSASATAPAFASATASVSAPASSSAGAQQMPQTGGSALGAPLLALAALFVGIAGFAYVRRVVRKP
jgi:alkaline phosphatase